MILKYKKTNIFYKKKGVGNVLVLLHGFLHSSNMWVDFAEKWSKSLCVISIDLPGHGKSGVVKSISISEMAEIVNAVLEKENISKTSIIGHSMGGYTGLAFVNLFPNKISKLILLHSSAYEDSLEVKKKRDLWLKIIDRHPSMFVRSVIEHLYAKEHLESLRPIIEKDIEDAKQVGFEGYIEATKAMRDRPSNIHVLKTDIPIFIVAGKLDKVIEEPVSIEQIDMLKKGNGIILEKSSHMGFIEEKENCFEALDSFLR